jgi:hypothetical protein
MDLKRECTNDRAERLGGLATVGVPPPGRDWYIVVYTQAPPPKKRRLPHAGVQPRLLRRHLSPLTNPPSPRCASSGLRMASSSP